MMQPCASAAKLRGGGPNLDVGMEAIGRCGSPPPRIVYRRCVVRTQTHTEIADFAGFVNSPLVTLGAGQRPSGPRLS
jgi:hypothetical protein